MPCVNFVARAGETNSTLLLTEPLGKKEILQQNDSNRSNFLCNSNDEQDQVTGVLYDGLATTADEQAFLSVNCNYELYL